MHSSRGCTLGWHNAQINALTWAIEKQLLHAAPFVVFRGCCVNTMRRLMFRSHPSICLPICIRLQGSKAARSFLFSDWPSPHDLCIRRTIPCVAARASSDFERHTVFTPAHYLSTFNIQKDISDVARCNFGICWMTEIQFFWYPKFVWYRKISLRRQELWFRISEILIKS